MFQVEIEQEYVVNKLEKKLNELNIERGKLDKYKIDLENQLEQEQEQIVNKMQKKMDVYSFEKSKLEQEKADLQRHVRDLQGQVSKLACDKVVLENTLEAEEESIVNRLQRQLEELIHRNRTLERKVERLGKFSESETSEDESSLGHDLSASPGNKFVVHRGGSTPIYSSHRSLFKGRQDSLAKVGPQHGLNPPPSPPSATRANAPLTQTKQT